MADNEQVVPEAEEKPKRGGRRPGAGRKPGSIDRDKKAMLKEIAESGLTPLEFLVKMYRNPNLEIERRIDAAKAACPYVHTRLQAIDIDANVNVSHEDALRELE